MTMQAIYHLLRKKLEKLSKWPACQHFYAIPDFLGFDNEELGVVVPYQARVRYYTSINEPM
jgi:hypothetical protein